MTVATLSQPLGAELCSGCGKVRPARSAQHCTLARARTLLEIGYCMCPTEVLDRIGTTGGLAALSPETQALYQPLVELSKLPPTMLDPVTFQEDSGEPLTTVDLVRVNEAEDVWEGPEEAAVPKTPATRSHRRKKTKRKTVNVVELKPVTDSPGAEPVWTHPEDPPPTDPLSIPTILGGGVITGPQKIPPTPNE